MGKIFATAVIILLVAGGLVFLLIRLTLFTDLPGERGALSVEGLRATVTVERLESGHSRLSAQHEDDLWFGLGFVHARDRLWQLQRYKWAADHVYSAHFGDVFLPADRLSALLTSQKDSVSNTYPEQFRRYADGINAFISRTGSTYPVQFSITRSQPEKWSAEDVQKTLLLQYWLLDTGWQQPLANVIAANYLPEGLLPFIFDEETLSVIRAIPASPDMETAFLELLQADALLRDLLHAPRGLPPVRTLVSENGQALISFQSAAASPGFWYDITLNTENSDVVHAFTLPGTPVLWAGASSGSAWISEIDSDPRGFMIPAEAAAEPDQFSALIRAQDGSEQRYTGARFDSFFRMGTDETYPFFRQNLPDAEQLTHTGSEIAGGHLARHTFAPPFRSAFEESAFPSGSEFHSELNLSALLLSDEGDARHLINTQRLEQAQKLTDILNRFAPVEDFRTILEYLSNWNGNYSRYSVSASLLEMNMIGISENTLLNYLPGNRFNELQRLGLIDYRIGAKLIESHHQIRSRDTGNSPVSDEFFGRRMREAVSSLRSMTGEEPFTWRWGSINSLVFTDPFLCNGTFLFEAPSRQACRRIGTGGRFPIQGQKDLAASSFLQFYDGQIRPVAFTSGYLFIDEDGGTTSRLLPGYTTDPFSPFYHQQVKPEQERSVMLTLPDTNPASRFILNPR